MKVTSLGDKFQFFKAHKSPQIEGETYLPRPTLTHNISCSESEVGWLDSHVSTSACYPIKGITQIRIG